MGGILFHMYVGTKVCAPSVVAMLLIVRYPLVWFGWFGDVNPKYLLLRRVPL